MHKLLFLASLVVSGCGAAVAGPAPKAPSVSPPAGPGAAGRMGVHGMVVFGGSRSVFMSHIPMFKAPHDYQLLVEVALPEDAAGRPASFSNELFTFEPERFSLDALRLGTLREITGTIFRGNFEDGGKPVMKNVRVAIKRLVGVPHPLTTEPAVAELRYTVLGAEDEAFVVHGIGAAPDFDQIATVNVRGATAADLAAGVSVVIPGRANSSASRLAQGVVAEARTAQGRAFTLTFGKELSCLVGPDFSSPCP